jgi:lysyl-tRNA synthetase class 2
MFPVLLDTSGRIQLFVAKDVLGSDEFDRLADVDAGDWVGAEGEVITTRKGELSVRVSSWVLLSRNGTASRTLNAGTGSATSI